MRLRLDPFSPNGVSVDNSTITVAGGSSTTGGSSVTVAGEDYLTLAAQEITANPIDLDNLSATGTPSGSTFLRGDNTWATPAGSGDVSKVGTPVDNQVGVWTGDGTIEGDADLTFDTTTNTLATVNIAPSGTVDGRDVATDGTKLDGIEAGADVTDNTNVLAALGFTPENVANKATDFSTVNDTLYPTVEAVQEAINTAVTGLLDYRGTYDASTNLFPATGGSGLLGAVLKGDFWIASVAGTLGGTAVTIGDLIIALVDTPGQTAANWDLVSNELGYVPLDPANNLSDLDDAPTALVNLGLTATAAEVNVLDGITASTAELNFVDGVTSAIQTQLDGKSSTSHTHLLTAGATDVTSSAAELNILDGATLSTAELNYVDGVTSSIQTQIDTKVTGPASATDNAVVRYNGTTGKLVQNSTEVAIGDTGIVHLGPTEAEEPYPSARLRLSDDTGDLSDVAITSYGGGFGGLTLTGAGGTAASPSNTTASAQVGQISFQKRAAGVYSDVAAIKANQGGNVTFVDANGNEVFATPTTVASAVNYIRINNSATLTAPTLEAVGDDTNIGIELISKGTGGVFANGATIATANNTLTMSNKTLTTPTIAQINNTTGVGVSVEHQTDNSNSIATSVVNGVKFKTGWGQMLGNSTITMSETVTFGNAFPTACLGVSVSPLGGVATTAATSIGGITAEVASNPYTGAATDIAAGSFNATLTRSGGTFGNTTYYAYTWIAYGY